METGNETIPPPSPKDLGESLNQEGREPLFFLDHDAQSSREAIEVRVADVVYLLSRQLTSMSS